MKNFKKFTLLLLFILSTLFLTDCKNEIENENFSNITTNANIDGIKIPDGTIVEKINNSTIKFKLPNGYKLWTLDKDGKFMMESEGSYTCKCSGSNGCDVFYVKGNYGCSHGSCTGSCTGSFNKNFTKSDFGKKAFIVNTNSGLERASEEDFDRLQYIPEGLLLNIEDELKDFAKQLYGEQFLSSIKHVDDSLNNKSDINDIMYVGMKIYGYKFIYGVNTNKLKPNIMKSNKFMVVDGGHSCKCASGNSGCDADSSWGVKYCKGGSCKECTMTVK